MLSARNIRAVLVLCFFLLSGCSSISPLTFPDKKTSHEVKKVQEVKPPQDVKEKVSKVEEPEDSCIDDCTDIEEVPIAPLGETQTTLEESIPSPNEEEKQPPPPEPSTPTNQELLDSALEFCQASNDFWEHGNLDDALDALDKAYSLILKVNTDDDPELLQQKEDLRFTISKRIIEIYASRFTVANGSHKAIPLVMNKHVQRALDLYKGRERAFFLDAYRRSGRYRPMILKALREAGLPEELSWLPLIESGFKIRAMSRARALGLWQFIASTGYKYGLKRDRWVDERMNPEKSTQAAIAYLKELHRIFGDWTTVLAAYNCGERRVLNLIRHQRIDYLDHFWDLYERLPRETAFYVPRFMAVLQIINNPEVYGFVLPPVEKPIETETVTINKQVHLKTIAKRLNMDYKQLRDMNAELRQYCTPKEPYSLKVPVGKGEILLAKLNDMPVWRPPVPAYRVHRVRYGESLSVIAQKYRTSVRAIMAMNGLRRRNYLRVGWKLRIPTTRISSRRLEKIPVQTASVKQKLVTYIVGEGDSLWKIANRFRTTTSVIKSLNQLSTSQLRVGQVLKVPARSMSSEQAKTRVYLVQLPNGIR
ncbi:MAG: LysM peptidoglycan-binding domain-containing protein [Deltaproteobacteria bacterium]|nr:LysM peptidoglycan-binding domain-containing protein [Deltaproteobacteria bacterium]